MGAEGESWTCEARKELEKEFRLQIYADGVDKEQALYYHLSVLEYALFLQVAGQRFGAPFSDQFCRRVANMAGFIHDVTAPGGTQPKIGDADDGFVTRFTAAWPANPYADVLEAEDLITHGRAGQRLGEKAFWYGIMAHCNDTLMGPSSDPRPPRSYPRIYPDSGYAVLGNKSCHLVFRTGQLGYLSTAAHGHADALNFTLALDGEWWLVDPGTYTYHREPKWRDHFRSTHAHNCVVVNGRDQSIKGGPSCGQSTPMQDCYPMVVDPPKNSGQMGAMMAISTLGVIHRREIQVDTESQSIFLFDDLNGHDSRSLEIWFQLAPDIQLARGTEEGIWTLHKSRSSRTVTLHLDPSFEWEALRGQEQPTIAGWYSSRLGHREPSYALRGHRDCSLPRRIETTIHYSGQSSACDTYAQVQ